MTSPLKEECLGGGDDSRDLSKDGVEHSPEGAAQNVGGASNALQTLTSGRKKEVRKGAIQAHICVVTCEKDVAEVMSAFTQADGFRAVTNWAFAYRIATADACSADSVLEAIEDGLDEGCGEKILGVLRRSGLNGLLLVVSRWQDYGTCSGLDLLGTELYSLVVERCKDLIQNLKQAVGMTDEERKRQQDRVEAPKPPPGPKNFDFGFLPPIPEPRVLLRQC
jgi:hypothetical protein